MAFNWAGHDPNSWKGLDCTWSWSKNGWHFSSVEKSVAQVLGGAFPDWFETAAADERWCVPALCIGSVILPGWTKKSSLPLDETCRFGTCQLDSSENEARDRYLERIKHSLRGWNRGTICAKIICMWPLTLGWKYVCRPLHHPIESWHSSLWCITETKYHISATVPRNQRRYAKLFGFQKIK